MKTILLGLLIVPFLTFAQSERAEPDGSQGTFNNYKWEIGINGGVNITNVAGLADSLSSIRRFGSLYGATVTYHFNRFLAIKTDFDFENKGWTINDLEVLAPDGITTTTQNVSQHLDYFDIPAFFRVGFGNRIKFDFNFGPYIAFLTENRTFYTDPTGIEIPVANEFFDNFSKTDFGLVYGGGIDFALGKRWSFGFDLLYEHGLKEINANGLKNTSIDFDFGINYLFGAKKKK